MNLPKLLSSILETHRWFSTQATRQINTAMILRNWLIGMYLFEYEQKGQDRAEYGERLYDEISNRLKKKGLKGLGRRNLYLFKDLYLAYPQIVQTVSAQLLRTGHPESMEFITRFQPAIACLIIWITWRKKRKQQIPASY